MTDGSYFKIEFDMMEEEFEHDISLLRCVRSDFRFDSYTFNVLSEVIKSLEDGKKGVYLVEAEDRGFHEEYD